MKKKRTILLLALVIIVSTAIGVAASEIAYKRISADERYDFTIMIDGVVHKFKNVDGEEVHPILFEGTTYLPVRAIGELMGKTVYWYGDDKRIELRDVKVNDADVITSGEKKDANIKSDSTEFIGIDKAKAIALEKAGFKAEDVRFDKAELDEDDGIWKYEIEFVTGQVEYDIDLGAVNGAILKWEVENESKKDKNKDNQPEPITAETKITAEEAKKIALNKAGLKEADVSFVKVEIDIEHNVAVYDIEFKFDHKEYNAEINADNGTILEWDIELDD